MESTITESLITEMHIQVQIINEFLQDNAIPRNQWFSHDAAEIISNHLYQGKSLSEAVILTITGQLPRTHCKLLHMGLIFLFENFTYASYQTPTLDVHQLYNVEECMCRPEILQYLHLFSQAELLQVIQYFLNFLSYRDLRYVISQNWDFESLSTDNLYWLSSTFNRMLSLKLDTHSHNVRYYIQKALQPAEELLLREQQPPRVPYFASCKKSQASEYYSRHFEEQELLPPARHAQFDKLCEIVKKNNSGEYNAFEYCGFASLGEIQIMLRQEPFRHVDSKNMVVQINRERSLVDYLSFIVAVAGNENQNQNEVPNQNQTQREIHNQNHPESYEENSLQMRLENELESHMESQLESQVESSVRNYIENQFEGEVVPPFNLDATELIGNEVNDGSTPVADAMPLVNPVPTNAPTAPRATTQASAMTISNAGTAAREDFRVKFEGEKGADGGGLKNEFIYTGIEEIFRTDYCMFHTYSNGSVWIDQFTLLDKDDIVREYTYFGILLGVAVLNGICIGDRLTKIFYKILLSEESEVHEEIEPKQLSDLYLVTYADVAQLDEQLIDGLNGLRSLKAQNVIIEDLGVTFAVSAERLGCAFTIDLIENGREIAVTKDTLEKYIKLRIDFEIFHQKTAIDGIRKGFTQVIPQFKYRNVFPFEMQQILGGKPATDLTQLESITKYNEPFNPQHPTIRMFWKIVHALNQHEKENFLLFIFSSHRVPVNGFTRFQIECSGDYMYGYPVAHTCGNVLCLPEYENEAVLVEKLLFAIENYLGFGIV